MSNFSYRVTKFLPLVMMSLAIGLSGCADSKKPSINDNALEIRRFNSYATALDIKDGAESQLVVLNVSDEWKKEGGSKNLDPVSNFSKSSAIGNHGEGATLRIIPKNSKIKNFEEFMNFQKGVMKGFCKTNSLFYRQEIVQRIFNHDAVDWSEYCDVSMSGTSEFLIGRVVDIGAALVFVYILDTRKATDVVHDIPLDALKGWLEDGRSKLDGFRVTASPIEYTKKP